MVVMAVTLSLDRKVALITGGSRGIGAAAVRMFVSAGARVGFNYQKARTEADTLVNACGAADCAAFQADLSTAESAEALVRATVEKFGALDILVANHGIWPADDVAIDRMTAEQ